MSLLTKLSPLSPHQSASKSSLKHSNHSNIVSTHQHSTNQSLNLFSLIALTWRIVYIGQAADSQYDQILEEAEMDDIQPGQMKFVFEVRLFWVK